MSPDGAIVFVTGASKKRGQRIDYLTVAHDARPVGLSGIAASIADMASTCRAGWS